MIVQDSTACKFSTVYYTLFGTKLHRSCDIIYDIQYRYRMSDIISDLRVPISNIRVAIPNISVPKSDVQYIYTTSDIQYLTSDKSWLRQGLGLGHMGCRLMRQNDTNISEIHIGLPISISEIGVILSYTAPHKGRDIRRRKYILDIA